MLDYKLIEAFATVISAGGFEKAATTLNLTQSAISQRVKSLEEQYGQVLLQRTTPPSPTDAGTILLTHYKQVKQLEDDLVLRRENEEVNYTPISIAVNEDSLATWFHQAVEPLMRKEKIILDIRVDDQDNTHELLQRGEVRACVSSKRTPLQGCKITRIGSMRYWLCATREFSEQWFRDGFNKKSCSLAPLARFNRKDELPSKVFRSLLGKVELNPPTFFIPSMEQYAAFVAEGHCYGIMPEIQIEEMSVQIDLVNPAPDTFIDVPLYYHCWSLQSEKMKRFDDGFVKNARQLLKEI